MFFWPLFTLDAKTVASLLTIDCTTGCWATEPLLALVVACDDEAATGALCTGCAWTLGAATVVGCTGWVATGALTVFWTVGVATLVPVATTLPDYLNSSPTTIKLGSLILFNSTNFSTVVLCVSAICDKVSPALTT